MFGKLLAVGIAFFCRVPGIYEYGGCKVHFIPATGIPLPFISYGGSSLFVSLCMFGVLFKYFKKTGAKD